VAPWNNAARTAAAQQGEALKDHCHHPNPWNNAARTAAAQQGATPEDHSLHPNPWNNAARTAVGQHGDLLKSTAFIQTIQLFTVLINSSRPEMYTAQGHKLPLTS